MKHVGTESPRFFLKNKTHRTQKKVESCGFFFKPPTQKNICIPIKTSVFGFGVLIYFFFGFRGECGGYFGLGTRGDGW